MGACKKFCVLPTKKFMHAQQEGLGIKISILLPNLLLIGTSIALQAIVNELYLVRVVCSIE